MYQKIIDKQASIAVVGMGYVGLPIALEFAKRVKVIGFDISEPRVEMLKNNIDPSEELDAEAFKDSDIVFTTSLEEVKKASFFIVAVPTPINEHNLPDLSPLLSATKTVGKALHKGDYVVFESTVYPGCTEEDCLPILIEESGLRYPEDFSIGYSPERINPGDKVHTLSSVVKVTAGDSPESSENIAKVYELVVKAGVHRASSIKVAEAAKIIENTQRDVNIALVNELSIIFNRMGINTFEVLEAAGTKWNFLKFQPGLVGGHCIGVDPYYLTYKAKEFGYHAQIINSGRFVNDSMGGYIAKQTVKKVVSAGKNLNEARVLVMGATFKEDVSDIRNSKVADVINELKSYSVRVEVVDPHASSEELEKEYGFSLLGKPGTGYDAVVVAVNHKDYAGLDEAYFRSLMSKNPVLIDIKGIYRGRIKDMTYWSL
ncbi:MAG TPA: nucleotide sugar dehydrogenase [Flavobacteriales bacterium]|nr:nucleotide sugar dehydrogenase [Flavobacteriales bacterium]